MTDGDDRRTAAAVAARRQTTHAALARVSRRAGVSRTFLYSNLEARALLADATAATRARTAQDLTGRDARQEAAWRERALNI